jgi:hypothetical protein
MSSGRQSRPTLDAISILSSRAEGRAASKISHDARERLFSRVVRLASGAAVLLVVGALGACDVPRPPQPRLWTLYDVQGLYAKGAPGSYAVATDAGLPGGVALSTMLDPADHTSLAVQWGWAEGYAVGYTTTEVWAFFDEVWAQPMYVPVTGWSGGMAQGASQQPIFSVGADSLFYSPFWHMIYVEVPDGAATSVREILDGKFPLHPARGWTAALAPADVGLGPMSAMPSGGAVMGTGWFDGAPAPFVKFPAAPFGILRDEVIEEVPIFHFVFVNDDGKWVAPAIPSVLGTGPLYAHMPTPKYSAYWRVYDVVLPPSARVFAPDGSKPDMALTDAGVKVRSTAYGPDVVDPANAARIADVLGRVVLSDACFDSLDHVAPRLGKCLYLDSQSAIETMIAQNAIVRTDVTVTCPLVNINGAAVTP